MISALRRIPNCLGASGCSFAISADWGLDEVWQGDSADTSRSHGSHWEPLNGFQGERVGRANFGEFLALQHLNYSTERWVLGALCWNLSTEGCWRFIPPGRASERCEFWCLLCRCNLQGNRIKDLIGNRAMGGGGQIPKTGIQ